MTILRTMRGVSFGGLQTSTHVPPHIWEAFLWFLSTEPPNATMTKGDFVEAEWTLRSYVTAPIPPFEYQSFRNTRFVKGGFAFWLDRRGFMIWSEFRCAQDIRRSGET